MNFSGVQNGSDVACSVSTRSLSFLLFAFSRAGICASDFTLTLLYNFSDRFKILTGFSEESLLRRPRGLNFTHDHLARGVGDYLTRLSDTVGWQGVKRMKI